MFVTPDEDECKNREACGKNAVCTNTVGSFVCACAPEYTGDAARGGAGCRDLDECRALERPCGTHAVCENAAPGYNCVCPQGYRAKPDPQIACEQVNTALRVKRRLLK